jgi:RimJ/RimL family protein N-acetyltransferase
MLQRIENDKLLLRKLKTYDFFDVYEYMSDEETMKFFVDGPFNKRKVMEMLNPDGEQEHYAVVLKSEKKVIGHIDFHKWFMPKTYEIGWAINRNYQGNNFGFEAAKLIMEHAFMKKNAHRIIATCQPENLASKSICIKLGMRLEGCFKKCIYDPRNNQWFDELFYAILNEEYRGKL